MWVSLPYPGINLVLPAAEALPCNRPPESERLDRLLRSLTVESVIALRRFEGIAVDRAVLLAHLETAENYVTQGEQYIGRLREFIVACSERIWCERS